MIENEDPNQCYDVFWNIINEKLNEIFPVTTIKKNIIHVHWIVGCPLIIIFTFMTPSLLKYRIEKYIIYKKIKQS